MTDSDGWLERYGEIHENLTYPAITGPRCPSS